MINGTLAALIAKEGDQATIPNDQLEMQFHALRRLVASKAGFAAANFIGYGHPERLVPQINAMGIPVKKTNFGITTTNSSTMYELVREGAGIAFLPTIMAEGRLGLRRIRPDAPVFNMETWLVTHREIQTNRRIRITFDHLAKEIAQGGWSNLVARS